jgi:sterol 3beta-glucosyltransferase
MCGPRAMRVAILTAGSRGDVDPYLALGSGLRDAGFTVRLATHVGFRDQVESQGLEFAAVVHPSDVLTADPRWEALQNAGDTAGRFVRHATRVARMIQPLLAGMLDDYWAACQGADAVISSISGIGGPQQAAALRIPHCWALVQPMSPTVEYAHFMAPGRGRLPGWVNLRTHVVAERVHWRLFRTAINRWVTANLGVGSVPRPAPGGLFGSGAGSIVYGISPSVVPRPRDWPPNIAQFGHWFLEAPPDETLPPELEDFLEAGPPPVYVHAGRIGVTPRGDFLAMVLRVFHRLGLRGLVSGSPAEPLPDPILAVPPVPFDRLFPRVVAVVHHGGAGTTAMALRAGIPSFGLPGFFDQPFWSARVAALGAGPRPVPVRRLTEARLEAAVAQLVGDTAIQARAADLGRRIRSERGVEESVAHLRGVLARARGGASVA